MERNIFSLSNEFKEILATIEEIDSTIPTVDNIVFQYGTAGFRYLVEQLDKVT